jgi:hypothetical protein
VGRNAVIVLYVLAMVGIVVAIDVLFLRNEVWPRLIVNIAIVLAFGAGYFKFLKGRTAA